MYDKLIMQLRGCADAFFCVSDCPKDPDTNCQEQLMKEAADAIEELQAQLMFSNDAAKSIAEKVPKWIPVTERLPEYDTNCIVFSGGEVKEAHFYYGKFYDPIEDYMRYNATHWMPLPSPPVEE